MPEQEQELTEEEQNISKRYSFTLNEIDHDDIKPAIDAHMKRGGTVLGFVLKLYKSANNSHSTNGRTYVQSEHEYVQSEHELVTEVESEGDELQRLANNIVFE